MLGIELCCSSKSLSWNKRKWKTPEISLPCQRVNNAVECEGGGNNNNNNKTYNQITQNNLKNLD